MRNRILLLLLLLFLFYTAQNVYAQSLPRACEQDPKSSDCTLGLKDFMDASYKRYILAVQNGNNAEVTKALQDYKYYKDAYCQNLLSNGVVSSCESPGTTTPAPITPGITTPEPPAPGITTPVPPATQLSVKITSPAKGQTITTSKFTVTVSYSSPAANPQVYLNVDKGSQNVYTESKNPSAASGSVSFSVNLSKQTAGTFTLKAGIVSGKAQKTDTITITYNPSGQQTFGVISVNSAPDGADLYIDGNYMGVTPLKIPDVPPGTYDVTIKADGYEDYSETATVVAGATKKVSANLKPSSAGDDIANVVIGVTGAGVVVTVITKIISALKGIGGVTGAGAGAGGTLPRPPAPPGNTLPRPPSPSRSSPLTPKPPPPKSTRIQDNPQPPPKKPQRIKEPQRIQMTPAEKNEILVDHANKIRSAVSGDPSNKEFVDRVWNKVVDDKGTVNEQKLKMLDSILKQRIIREKMTAEIPDYTYTNAAYDTVKEASNNLFIRLGSAYLSLGYSEMALLPVSSVTSMGDSIMAGASTKQAVVDGFKNGIFQLATGEFIGRIAFPAISKFTAPYISKAASLFSDTFPSLTSKLSSMTNSVKDVMSRDIFMKQTEVVKLGGKTPTPTTQLGPAEKDTLKIINDKGLSKTLKQNSELVPAKTKDAIALTKQKVYQGARDDAIKKVIDQMKNDGIPVEDKTFFIKQTGTHAQPGNPGYNPLKSDYDITPKFGDPKYDQMYKQSFEESLKKSGTSAEALDANVYVGTSGKGAYEGGALKWLENYNQNTGSDLMIRTMKDGEIVVSREISQTSDSILNMTKDEVASGTKNFQKFFNDKIASGSSTEELIKETSKEVSRKAGQYSMDYVKNFHETGGVSYKLPDAARVADLIKKKGIPVDEAMKQAGYGGSKEQLLNDFKRIMGGK